VTVGAGVMLGVSVVVGVAVAVEVGVEVGVDVGVGVWVGVGVADWSRATMRGRTSVALAGVNPTSVATRMMKVTLPSAITRGARIAG